MVSYHNKLEAVLLSPVDAATLEPHKIAEQFPLHSRPRVTKLVESVKKLGLLHSIVLIKTGSEYQILAGRHRYRACSEAGVEPRFDLFLGSEQEAVEFAIADNGERGHYSLWQAVRTCLNLMPLLGIEARKRQGKKKKPDAEPQQTGRTAESLAEQFGIGARSIFAGAELKEKRPDLAAELDADSEGKLTLWGQYERMKADEKSRNSADAPTPNAKKSNGPKPAPATKGAASNSHLRLVQLSEMPAEQDRPDEGVPLAGESDSVKTPKADAASTTVKAKTLLRLKRGGEEIAGIVVESGRGILVAEEPWATDEEAFFVLHRLLEESISGNKSFSIMGQDYLAVEEQAFGDYFEQFLDAVLLALRMAGKNIWSQKQAQVLANT